MSDRRKDVNCPEPVCPRCAGRSIRPVPGLRGCGQNLVFLVLGVFLILPGVGLLSPTAGGDPRLPEFGLTRFSPASRRGWVVRSCPQPGTIPPRSHQVGCLISWAAAIGLAARASHAYQSADRLARQQEGFAMFLHFDSRCARCGNPFKAEAEAGMMPAGSTEYPLHLPAVLHPGTTAVDDGRASDTTTPWAVRASASEPPRTDGQP